MMTISKVAHTITKLFSDENLTKKAYLNILNRTIIYVTKLLVGFIITPMMVSGLGSYQFGLWQILNRFAGYLNPVTGRPTEVLQLIIAQQQSSTEYEKKRQYVGSMLIVWGLFIPLTTILGAIFTWYVPVWIGTPSEYHKIIRITMVIMVLIIESQVFTNIPESILRGENLGYKRMGLTFFLTLIGGVLTWVALYLQTGLIGVAVSALISTILGGILYLILARRYVPWFGITKPKINIVRKFLSLSGWFIVWNLIWKIMTASDVVILGLFTSAETVTIYTLTKYPSEILITIISILAAGITPGLGGIIGSGDILKASRLRGELMSISWLAATALGTAVLQWNYVFIHLWVGKENYAGQLSTLLIVVMVVQFILIQTDATIIDTTLRLKNKVILGTVSTLITILTAVLLTQIINLGIVGLCLGFIIGRMILSLGYPIIIGHSFELKLSSQFKGVFRPALVSILLFLLAYFLDVSKLSIDWSGVKGWILFLSAAGISSIITLVLAFYLGLSKYQQGVILNRIRTVLLPNSKD